MNESYYTDAQDWSIKRLNEEIDRLEAESSRIWNRHERLAKENEKLLDKCKKMRQDLSLAYLIPCFIISITIAVIIFIIVAIMAFVTQNNALASITKAITVPLIFVLAFLFFAIFKRIHKAKQKRFFADESNEAVKAEKELEVLMNEVHVCGLIEKELKSILNEKAKQATEKYLKENPIQVSLTTEDLERIENRLSGKSSDVSSLPETDAYGLPAGSKRIDTAGM